MENNILFYLFFYIITPSGYKTSHLRQNAQTLWAFFYPLGVYVHFRKMDMPTFRFLTIFNSCGFKIKVFILKPAQGPLLRVIYWGPV